MLALITAAAGLACLAAPFLLWLSRSRQPVECGWTCYVPLGADGHAPWVRETGRTGFGVDPGLGAVLVVAGVVALATAALLGRGRGAPARMAWALGLLGTAAFGWSLAVILRRTAGDTWVVAEHGGALQPSTGPGAWAALIGAAVLVGLAAMIVVRRRHTPAAA